MPKPSISSSFFFRRPRNCENLKSAGRAFFLAWLLVAASTLPALANSYSTSFPLAQNPISESGAWLNGKSNGTNWNNCATATGFAYGTQSGTGNYDDSICGLTGTWGPNQSAQITIKINGANTAQFEEAEVHLNTTISANSITGYEINCSVVPGDPYLQIVRWNGALGSFTLLDSRAIGCVNGDVLSAARSGNTITAYKNGQAQFSVTDSTYNGGAPGMGFYIQTILSGTAAQANGEFGAAAFSANDGQSGSGGGSTPALSSLSCSPTSLGPSSSTSCTVTLTQAAPSGGVSVSLASSNSLLSLPASVTVASGSSSASLTGTSGNITSNQTATLTASLNGGSKTVSISLVPPQGSQGSAPITYVQGNYSAPWNPQSKMQIPYTKAQIAGDLNVVVVGWNDSTAVVQSVTDSRGNVYTRAVGPTVQSGVASQSIYFAKNIAAAGANVNSVTVKFSAAARFPDIRIAEYSGASTTSPVDATAANAGNGANSSASIATVSANDLILAGNLVQTVSTGPGSGYTQRMLTNDGDIVEDRIAASTGTYAAISPVNPSAQWIMQIVAFKPAASSGGTGTLVAPVSLTCASSSLTGAATDVCTVTLSAGAPAGGLSVSLSSSGSSVTVPASVTIAAGSSAATFTASAVAVTTSQSVTLTASANGTSKTSGLQLNACVAKLSVNASSVSFGSVALNSPATQSISLTSSGTSALTVSSEALSGAGFSVSGTAFPVTLNPGQSAVVNIQFDPTVAGAVAGQLTINSNSSTGSSTAVVLSGTGVASTVNLSWDPPAASSDPIAGYRIYRQTSGGSNYQLMNVSVDTQTVYIDSNVQAGASYNYYVTTVDSSGIESSASSLASVAVP